MKGKGKYLKVYKDHVLRDGTFLNIKSPQEEREDAMASFEAGRIGEETLNKILKRLDEQPDYVVANVTYDKSEE
jgi:hypothetical protein